MYNYYADLLAEATATQAFIEADVDENGVLTFDEFEKWYTQHEATTETKRGPWSHHTTPLHTHHETNEPLSFCPINV